MSVIVTSMMARRSNNSNFDLLIILYLKLPKKGFAHYVTPRQPEDICLKVAELTGIKKCTKSAPQVKAILKCCCGM